MDTEHQLYKGDSNAMKSAGHELKSVISIYNCRIKGIHLALMALVDYRGFRMICSTRLPLSKNSLCYGSADAGVTVHNSEEKVGEMMRELGKQLNIAEHKVNQSLIVGPGDIEGHKGSDGKFYLLDLARLFPPERPENNANAYKIWFQLLRPELVLKAANFIGRPLCSDVFSSWLQWVSHLFFCFFLLFLLFFSPFFFGNEFLFLFGFFVNFFFLF